MNYGFVINNETCIGCHACSTACKSENEVPLGVNRTWVKSVEKGAFPNVRRHFQVSRCNHCENPPCVRICPVSAMYQRDDGIVEFNGDACIGCKACLQACPYDAIYIDPDSGTAAKCHYCAHRLDVGLEPACVVVCPEHAIIAGDMHDPDSEIGRVLAERKVTVRKPEQGTVPNVFYIGGEDAAMHPTATERSPATFAWADTIGDTGVTLGGDGAQGIASTAPITLESGRVAEQMVQVAYNAQHKVPWHWPVPAYLVTKGIAAGIAMILAIGVLMGLIEHSSRMFFTGAIITIGFTALTTLLLVLDLEKPERFLRVLTRPQWRSWLTRGAYLLVGFSAVGTIWALVEYLMMTGIQVDIVIHRSVVYCTALLGAGTAVYTAYLFGQAEGRDLWQGSLLPVHLLIQAFMAGAAALLVVALLTDYSALAALSRTILLVGLGVDLIVLFAGEMGMSHSSDSAALAAREMHRGRYRFHYWVGAILVGHVIPLIGLGLHVAEIPVSFCVLIGLFAYEYAFVMAPQQIPNS